MLYSKEFRSKKLKAGVSILALSAALGASEAYAVAYSGATNITSGDTDITLDGTDTVSADTAFTLDASSGPVGLRFVDGTATFTSITADASADSHTLVIGEDTTVATTIIVTGDITGNAPTSDDDKLFIDIVAEDSGGNGADMILRVAGDINLGAGAILFNDDDSDPTSEASLHLNGSSAQAITTSIEADSNGDGILLVTNSGGVTFNLDVGNPSENIGRIEIGDGSAAGGLATFSSILNAFILDMDATGGAVTSTFSGATTIANDVTFTAGNDAGENVIATFSDGFTVTGDNILLNDDGGTVTLNFDGNTTYAAKIDGSSAGEGNIVVRNATGATFSDTIGTDSNTINTITIGNATSSTSGVAIFSGAVATAGAITIGVDGESVGATTNSATFEAATTASSIVLGEAAGGTDTTDSNTITFGGTGASYSVTGAISDADAADTNLLKVSSTAANTITFINNVDIGTTAGTDVITLGSTNGANTTVEFREDVTAGTINLGDGAGTDTITARFAVATTSTIAGAINGTAGDTSALLISDTDTGVDDTVTFSGILGGETTLTSITIGDSNSTDGGRGVFNSAVTATTITIDASDTGDNSASQADFNGAVTGTTIALDAGDAAAEDASATFAGDVTANITMEDGTNGAITTVTFDGSSTQTVTGAIGSDTTAGEGTVNVNNDVIFTSTVGDTRLLALTVSDNKTMTVGTSGSTTAVGASTITLNGTLKPLGGIVLEDGSSLVLAANSAINITNASAFGSNAVIDADGANVDVTVNSGTVNVTVPAGLRDASIVLIDADGTGTYTENGSFNVTNTSSVTDYTITTDSDVVTLTVGPKPATDVATNLGVAKDTAGALTAALTATSGDATVAALYNAAIDAGGSEAINVAKKSEPSPAALGSSSAVLANAGSASLNTASIHLASLRSNYTGMSTGDSPLEKSFWTRAFGNNSAQETKDLIDGYDSTTFGAAFGVDLYRSDEKTIGVSFSYANTNIDGEGVSNSDTDVKSYQATVYGDYKTDKWYVDGYLGYALNSVKTNRSTINSTAFGEYDGDQYLARIGAGMPFKIGDSLYAKPKVGFTYVHISNDAYTETGAGVSNLTVTPDNIDIAEADLSIKLGTIIDMAKGKLSPNLKLGVKHDFIGDQASASSRYVSGGSQFTTSSASVEKTGILTGLGLEYKYDDISITASYDAEIKDDYSSHSGSIQAKFRF